MSNSRYNYYDPEYNPGQCEGNDLLILITGEVFSFAVLKLEDKKVLVWGEHYALAELTEPDALKSVLTAKYNEVKLGVQSSGFTIIPKELYDNDKVADYGRFLIKHHSDSVLVNKLDADNYVVFKVDHQVSKAISANFDLRSVYFAGKAWITAVNYARPYTQPLHINIEGDVIQLLYLNDGKLAFYNSFDFNNPDELMYYTVLVANELGLNLDATSVILSGDISHSDKKIQRLNDLLPKVYFNQNKVVELPDGFMSHQILMLAGLSSCAS